MSGAIDAKKIVDEMIKTQRPKTVKLGVNKLSTGSALKPTSRYLTISSFIFPVFLLWCDDPHTNSSTVALSNTHSIKRHNKCTNVDFLLSPNLLRSYKYSMMKER